MSFANNARKLSSLLYQQRHLVRRHHYLHRKFRCTAQTLHARRFTTHPSPLPKSHPFNTPPRLPQRQYQGNSQPTPERVISLIPRQHQDAEVQHQLEIADALRPSFQSQTPLLLRHAAAQCDAVYFWRSLEYWSAAVGDDTAVEVEIGKGYNNGDRVTMRLGDFVDYLRGAIKQEHSDYEYYQKHKQLQQQSQEDDIAYLAQNELFHEVINDVSIPHLCHQPSLKVGEGKLYHTMIWMGPRNTVSPLHYDPMDNLLIQMVGWKRVLLFSPSNKLNDGTCDDSIFWHYSGVDGNQYNTSAVDIEDPNFDKYPNFKAAPTPFECLLGPGDALFIPKKWWHHVRSLEFSVSANAWWR